MTAVAADPKVQPLPDARAIREFCERHMLPEKVYEVRIPRSRRGPRRFFGTVSGYFNAPDAVAAALTNVTGQDAEAVYITLNPVNPDLLARAINRLENNARTTAADTDVTRRRALVIDVDPEIPTGIQATDEERAAALARRDAVETFLTEQYGWSPPYVRTMSGNGGGLLYWINLPNDDEAATLVAKQLRESFP